MGFASCFEDNVKLYQDRLAMLCHEYQEVDQSQANLRDLQSKVRLLLDDVGLFLVEVIKLADLATDPSINTSKQLEREKGRRQHIQKQNKELRSTIEKLTQDLEASRHECLRLQKSNKQLKKRYAELEKQYEHLLVDSGKAYDLFPPRKGDLR